MNVIAASLSVIGALRVANLVIQSTSVAGVWSSAGCHIPGCHLQHNAVNEGLRHQQIGRVGTMWYVL